MEAPENLRKLRVVIRVKKGEMPDLKGLVELMETEIGFAPVTEVTLDATGRFVHREGELTLDVGGGRTFIIKSAADTPDGTPPENVDVTVVAAFIDPRSSDRLVLRQWKPKAEVKPGS